MAFWALGKVKGLSSNLKDVGSKLKSYVNVSSQFDIQINSKQEDATRREIQQSKSRLNNNDKKYSQEQLLQIQTREYQKLTRIQQSIMNAYKAQEEHNLLQKNRILQQQLNQILDQQYQQKQDYQKNSIIHQIQSGKKSIQELIQENLCLREQIQSSKVNASKVISESQQSNQ